MPLKVTLLEPLRNNSNCASAGSPDCNTSLSISPVASVAVAAVYKKSILPDPEIRPPMYFLELSP